MIKSDESEVLAREQLPPFPAVLHSEATAVPLRPPRRKRDAFVVVALRSDTHVHRRRRQ